jgi:hypothetical protein
MWDAAFTFIGRVLELLWGTTESGSDWRKLGYLFLAVFVLFGLIYVGFKG